MADRCEKHQCSELERIVTLEEEVKMLTRELVPEGRCSVREELAKLKTAFRVFSWVGAVVAAASIAQIIAFLSSKGIP